MDVTKAFATRLKALREECGLSQDDLGKHIGISRGSISFYEKQSRTPDILILSKISEFFNVSIDYLMGYSESKTSLGVSIENDIGLSENSIEALRSYKSKFAPDDMKLLNRIIQHEDIMKICVLIDTYNKNMPEINSLQSAMHVYLASNVFFYGHNKQKLNDYLKLWEDIFTVNEDQINELDHFVNEYIKFSSNSGSIAGCKIQLKSLEEDHAGLLDEAAEIFDNIIDDLTPKGV
ncbi:MAG: helix-turn-helix transcriptional regulator [Clostridia bacterium]|nr:helix-turn-helix transcriptional regulator [Clostridia bacterium]